MATAVLIQKESAVYSKNLLDTFYDFVTPTSFTIVSGGSNASLNEVTNNVYSSSLSIKVTQLIANADLVFDKSGNTTTASLTGSYIFSGRVHVRAVDNDCTVTLRCQLFVNDVILPANDFDIIVNNSGQFVFGSWNTFAQKLSLTSADRVDLRFIARSTKVGSEILIDGLKLEINDRSVSGCSIYSKP